MTAAKCYGEILALVAAAICALGVADVVLTMQYYCTPSGANYCSTSMEPYLWVWVAPGIWGAIPIFLTGLYAQCNARNNLMDNRFYLMLLFSSAAVFAPAITVLSFVEWWRGGTAEYTFYMTSSQSAGSITPNPNPWQAKMALPLTIGIIGIVLTLYLALKVFYVCCCHQEAQAPAVVTTMTRVVEEQSPCPPRTCPPETPCDPCERFSSVPYMPTRYNNLPYYGVASALNVPARFERFSPFFER